MACLFVVSKGWEWEWERGRLLYLRESNCGSGPGGDGEGGDDGRRKRNLERDVSDAKIAQSFGRVLAGGEADVSQSGRCGLGVKQSTHVAQSR